MKARKILSLIFNTIAVIASIVGLLLVTNLGAIIYVKFFTILTNCFIILSGCISIGYSLEYLLKKDREIIIPPVVYVLKLVTAASAFLTFLTVVTYLQYQPGLVDLTPDNKGFWENICHHYLAPLAFIAGLIFLDVDRKYNFKLAFIGPALVFVYMCYAVPICLIDTSIFGGAPYIFLDPAKVPAWAIILGIFLFLVVTTGLSVILWVLNRICFLIFTGDDEPEEATSEEEEKEIEQVVVSQEEKEEVEKITKSGYKGPRIYHISKRDDKMWQVKFANGQKAIKLFNTQAEAIVFAKKLAKSQEGSIRVHSLKGRIRKAS